TGMHLMLGGEGFWIFNKRLKRQYGVAPTYIDLPLPQSIREKLDSDNEISSYLCRAGLKDGFLVGTEVALSAVDLDVPEVAALTPLVW
ncbi:MAG TPA: hypothetical protein VGM98_09290, partial [Schlesneria sp.]